MPPLGWPPYKLNRARTNATALLIDTCTIRGTAGSPRAMTTKATNVPCRYYTQPNGTMAPAQELNNQFDTGIFDLPWNQAISLDDLIDHNGHTYQVWDTINNGSPLLVVSVRVRRVTT